MEDYSKNYNKCNFIAEKSLKNIIFKNKGHKNFFNKSLLKCRYLDEYHVSMLYCLGIDEEIQKRIDTIYNFNTGILNTECLKEAWQTSTTKKVIRMAISLYNGAISIYDYETTEDQLKEYGYYTIDHLFCCEYAIFFCEAIKLRYPEYCARNGKINVK